MGTRKVYLGRDIGRGLNKTGQTNEMSFVRTRSRLQSLVKVYFCCVLGLLLDALSWVMMVQVLQFVKNSIGGESQLCTSLKQLSIMSIGYVLS